MLHSYSIWNRKKTTFITGHYICNLSVTDIGMFGYVDVINVLLNSGTFLLVQWVKFDVSSVFTESNKFYVRTVPEFKLCALHFIIQN
jgi:hypothetical protein